MATDRHTIGTIAQNTFAQDVHAGLSAVNKYLQSKYFYDEKGSELFRQIMNLPEYYLSRAELDIFQHQADDLIAALPGNRVQVVELGAGDGSKTIELLKAMFAARMDVSYYPMDISAGAIDQLSNNLLQSLPKLSTTPIVGDYFAALNQVETLPGYRKLLLFLGSNIGNYQRTEALDLLQKINNTLQPGDFLLLGVDLKKEPAIIAQAYNDAQGVTRAFNLNLLSRINRELGGEFVLDNFDFTSTYHPDSGEVRSYLVSLQEQEVYITACKNYYHFAKSETIFTELSRKYDMFEIEELADLTGYTCRQIFTDSNRYFADCLLMKI